MPIVRRIFQVFGITAMFCVCVAVCQAGAAGLDGSGPLICAFTNAAECDSRSGCVNSTAEDIGLPAFFRVDFNNKKIVGAGPVVEGAKMETQIKSYERRDGQLIFQGIDVRAWSLVIIENTGWMTLTASGDDEAFVLFGACIVQ
jgi:hypothetical protein